MLWCLIKYMPYLVQRLWWWLTVIFHHCLCIGTQATPYSLHRNTSDKYFLMTSCNWRLNKTNDRGHTRYWGCSAVQWPASLQTCMLVWAPAFTWTLGKSLSLQKASSHSYDSDVHALTAFPLLGPSRESSTDLLPLWTVPWPSRVL